MPKMLHKQCAPRPRDQSSGMDVTATTRQPGGRDKTSVPRRQQPSQQSRQPVVRDKPNQSISASGMPGPVPVSVPVSVPVPAPLPPTTASPQTQTQKTRRKCRQVACSQSLEDLKFEKLGIYNKISLTQERIIGALDRLQNSLLQLQVPECNSQERKKRERNAFEFCVRFSRNFLYPLKGMIDDVRRTPVTYFHSATSNEACQRVVCVYGLMHQSIATYQRQLRYFLLDKVPQKLSALMEMIYTLSNTCLEKGILDRHDPVVECLQERSTKFLTFIEDMQEERFKLAREQYRRAHKQATTHQANAHPHAQHPQHTQHTQHPKHAPARKHKQNFDLKMCLNDHKLYEPRLVPKKKPQELKRTRLVRTKASVARATAPGAENAAQNLPDMLVQQAGLEDVKTQVEMDELPYMKWLGLPKAKLAEQKGPRGTRDSRDSRHAQKEDELQQALLEAFRHVSRSQVHQVLDPLMRSLGTILDEKIPKH